MSKTNLPATVPSLARAFEAEREALREVIVSDGLSSTQAAIEARRALDRTGAVFARQTENMQIEKAGLWLLEMVKSGAGIVDSGARAEVIWREVPKTSRRVIAGSTVFYSAAAIFMVAGFVQASRLTIGAALVLAALRYFDPKDWKQIWRKIPFFGRKNAGLLEAPNGQAFQADTHISIEAGGFVDALADSLRTADHVLLRLAEPEKELRWQDDPRLTAFVQGLLEAKAAKDGSFAIKLIGSDLESILRADGIEIVDYSRKTKDYFDVLPALDMDGGKDTVQAAPALMSGGQVLRRGTIWKADSS